MENHTQEQNKENKPWQFKPGESGNPNGRPKGSKNKATLIKEDLLKIFEERIDEAKKLDFPTFIKVVGSLLPKEQRVDLSASDPLSINVTLNECKPNTERTSDDSPEDTEQS